MIYSVPDDIERDALIRNLLTYIFYVIGGIRASVSSDGKRLPLPMDTKGVENANTKCVIAPGNL